MSIKGMYEKEHKLRCTNELYHIVTQSTNTKTQITLLWTETPLSQLINKPILRTRHKKKYIRSIDTLKKIPLK